MRSLQMVRTIAFLSGVALTATACGGAGFDPPEKIKGLRVLALQKDIPYPSAGDTVNLKLLYWDGKANGASPRNISVQALGCENPKADLYYNCGEELLAGNGFAITPVDNGPAQDGGEGGADTTPTDGSATEADTADSSDLADGLGADGAMPTEGSLLPYEADHVRRFTFRAPEKDSQQRPIIRPRSPGVEPYGLLYVLFSACAGDLGLGDPAIANGLPITCRDSAGNLLGPDDFVPGYASLYVYADRHNNNPVIRDFLFDHKSIQGSPGLADSEVRHVPRCSGGACPAYDIKLGLDQAANQEKDPGSVGLDGQELWEQMWLALYSTGGDFEHPLRLVNDAAEGWNEDNGSTFTAPAEPGPVRIWAVVHDNRGGVAWIEGKIIVD